MEFDDEQQYMKSEDEFMLEIVGKLAYKKTIGGKEWPVDVVKSWFASTDQGRVEDAIYDLLHNPDTPVRGDDSDNVRLTSISEMKAWYARQCLLTRSQDLWWLEIGGCHG